jgi:aminoglycoside/choline kinase family phosphotransferase
MHDDRAAARFNFAQQHLPSRRLQIEVASADASFRSYWRVRNDAQSFIVMDAPPDKENIAPWLDVGERLHAVGLHTPQVFAVDRAQGFILMEDLGTRAYLPELNTRTADALYADALDALLTLQTRVSAQGLPAFDEAFLAMELELMPTWFLERHLGYTPSCGEWDVIELAFRCLIDCARRQPQVFMHRDFHSRNLMIVDQDTSGIIAPGRLSPGIIDFQGAMLGPITYDLASLLRDCYIAWPIEQVDAWVEQYRRRLVAAGAVDVDGAHWRRWFDLAGLQRHIKVLGLFCRLHYRDGKAAYLGDLPLVLDYVLSVAKLYPELTQFAALIEHAVAARDITRPNTETSAVVA